MVFCTSRPKFLQKRQLSKAEVDEFWTGYAAAIPGFAGSWLTFWYFGAIIWTIFSLGLRRYQFVLPKHAWPFTIACWGFSAVMVISASINSGVSGLWITITKVIAIATAPFLITRFRISDAIRSREALFTYAPLGAACGFAMGLAQLLGLHGTVGGVINGGAGNATIFGAAMAWMGLLSLANCQSVNWQTRVISIGGFLLAMVAVVLSQSRSLYPCILLFPLIYYWTNFSRFDHKAKLGFVSIAAIVVISGFALRAPLSDSITSAIADLELLREGSFNSSLGNRAALWTAAVYAIGEKPLLGYGEAEKMAAVVMHLPEQVAYLKYSHVHNALLDATVSGGILGAAAFIGLFVTPLFFVFRRTNCLDNNRSKYTVISVLVMFGLNGSVNLLFTHDLLSVLYFLPLVIIAAIELKPADPLQDSNAKIRTHLAL